jgi:hypothetical protein
MRTTYSDYRTLPDFISPQLYFLIILSFKFSYQNSVTIFNTSHTCHMTRYVIFLSLIILTICGREYKLLLLSPLLCNFLQTPGCLVMWLDITPVDSCKPEHQLATWSFESGLRRHAGMECPSFHRHLERWRQWVHILHSASTVSFAPLAPQRNA